MRGGRAARVAGAVGALALLVGSAGGCGLPVEDEATPVPDAEVPFGLLAPSGPPTTAPPVAGPTVLLHLVRDGRLVAVPRVVADDDPAAVLAALAAGPTAAEEEEGLDSLLTTTDGVVAGVEVRAGVAVVALAERFIDLPADGQVLALGQVVCTLTSLPGIGQVRVRLGDRFVEVPRADGTLTADPVSRDDYGALLAA